MPQTSLHPAAVAIEQLLAQCDAQFVRRSGPGGQHRNKVATAVVLTHRPTGVQAEANERRSQAENRTVAIFRLRVNLALEVRTTRELVGSLSRDLVSDFGCHAHACRGHVNSRENMPTASVGMAPIPFQQAVSPLWQSRCRGGRISINPTHDDFPALLAEALDVIAADDLDPKLAGERLGCNVSQLVKLLKKEPRALAQVNRERASRGLHPLQ